MAKKTLQQVEQEQYDRVMNTVAWRCAYYRANPQRFAKDYLLLDLKWFQKILIWAAFHFEYFMFLASRGLGKSFILAIYCVIRAILWPGSEIAVSSKTRKQSAEILDKIQNILLPASPYLQNEIIVQKMVNNTNNGFVPFVNGSIIKTVAANENSRHNRAHVLVVDEVRMVDPVILNTVLRKFLVAPRQPGYINKPEYRDYPKEPNRELYATSCWYESSWAFKKAQAFCANMIRGRSYFICSLPYQVALMCGLMRKEQIENEMSEADFSELAFRMESEALWIGSGEDGLYQFDDIERCRRIKYPWMPSAVSAKTSDKKIVIPKKKSQEIRILSIDIALMASTKNDNDAASLFINSMTPISATSGTKYISNIMYTENMEGMRSDALALRIRKMFDDYDCDHLVIDAKGNGLPIVDLLMGNIHDYETGISYDALGCCNNEEIHKRCAVKNARKVIWAVMGHETFNSQCALLLREALRNGTLRLLQSDYDCGEELMKINGYEKLNPEDKQLFKNPYMHTTLLVNELVNLQAEQKAGTGTIRVKERSGMRKDRYSSLSYNIFVAKELERKLARPKNDMSAMASLVAYRRPIIT